MVRMAYRCEAYESVTHAKPQGSRASHFFFSKDVPTDMLQSDDMNDDVGKGVLQGEWSRWLLSSLSCRGRMAVR